MTNSQNKLCTILGPLEEIARKWYQPRFDSSPTFRHQNALAAVRTHLSIETPLRHFGRFGDFPGKHESPRSKFECAFSSTIV